MSAVEKALADLGLGIPPLPPEVGNYVGAVTVGELVFVSGHAPWQGREVMKGKLGRDVDVAGGQEAARVTIVNALASLKQEIGDLDRVKRVVKVLGMVNCTPDFVDTPQVIDGASDVLTTIFGERGKHSRSAVGFSSLPMGMPVEIEMMVQI